MSGPQPERSTVKWQLLEVLGTADRPLSNKELGNVVGISPTYARDSLMRPRRARWVETTMVPSLATNNRKKLVYTITDLGRRVLAEHQNEEKESS